MEFQDCLGSLASFELPSVPLYTLRCLSGLDAEQLAQFQRSWEAMETGRRRAIADALAELAEDEVELDFVPVFRALMRDPDPEVRASAAGSLWEDSETAGLDLLVDALRNDPDAEVRAAAATSLGSAVEMIEFEELGGMPAWQVKYGLLEAYQKDPDTEVRRRALESLAFLSEPPIPDMIQEAYDSADKNMKVSALYAMGRNASDRWRDTILKELRKDPVMREAAADALEMLHSLADPLSFHLDFNPNGRETGEDEDLP